MKWDIKISKKFNRSSKKIVTEGDKKCWTASDGPLYSFRLSPTVNTKHMYSTPDPHCGLQIWDFRMPSLERKSGKSSGYRMMVVLDILGATMVLDYIAERDALDWKGQSGKKQPHWDTRLEELKDCVDHCFTQESPGKEVCLLLC